MKVYGAVKIQPQNLLNSTLETWVVSFIDGMLCLCVTERVNQGYESLASLRHAYLDSFFLEPEDIKFVSLGAIWNFSKAIGLP
jgi:hypothetical protein